ncbi:MAG TPA: hypothetical protein VEW72_01390 [Burkholderiales bacterium]|nr:hypothetical protein [Burkholderiales bacterium]
MARRMKAIFSSLRAFGIVVLASGVIAANAQALRDPTRPPGIPASKAGPAVASSGLVLQSILISPERKAAVISGKVLGPGESIDGYMLIAIAEDEAVLKNGDKVRRLRLYPGVDMKHEKEIQGGAGGAQSGAGDRQ